MKKGSLPTETGLDMLSKNPGIAKNWGRCGLLLNQASVTSGYQDAAQVCLKVLGSRLKALFGPQHGYQGTAQDNMIETGHGEDNASGLRVFSLYSETREPSAPMFSDLDTLIIDLQIVGCRIYTFKSTILACMKAAKKYACRVVILDRPNPLGGAFIEGRRLDPELRSFVGPARIPMRHGLTPGEFARFVNQEAGCELEVITLKHWNSAEGWHATGRPWVLTSPNLPTLEPVFVYPGTVIFEACNVSEGRGTGLPFQFIGHPYCKDKTALLRRFADLNQGPPEGMILRPACFEPVFGKWRGRVCHGFQIHVEDPDRVRSFRPGLAMVRAFRDLCGEAFSFKAPPYEYEYERSPLDLILGLPDSQREILSRDPGDPYWQEGLAEYITEVTPFLLYGRDMAPLA